MFRALKIGYFCWKTAVFIKSDPSCLKVDSAIHRINHYLVDKYYGNQLGYPMERDLSSR